MPRSVRRSCDSVKTSLTEQERDSTRGCQIDFHLGEVLFTSSLGRALTAVRKGTRNGVPSDFRRLTWWEVDGWATLLNVVRARSLDDHPPRHPRLGCARLLDPASSSASVRDDEKWALLSDGTGKQEAPAVEFGARLAAFVGGTRSSVVVPSNRYAGDRDWRPEASNASTE